MRLQVAKDALIGTVALLVSGCFAMSEVYSVIHFCCSSLRCKKSAHSICEEVHKYIVCKQMCMICLQHRCLSGGRGTAVSEHMLKMLHLLLLHPCDQTALPACPCQSAQHMSTSQTLLPCAQLFCSYVTCANSVTGCMFCMKSSTFDTGSQERSAML